MSVSGDRESTSLKQLIGAADHIDRLLSAKSAEHAVELAAELLLATSGASGVVIFANGPGGLEEQWAAGQLEGGEKLREALAQQVIESGDFVLKSSMCAIPLSAGRVYAVLVAQGGTPIKSDLAALLTSLGSRGLEAAALRVAAAKQQQLRLSLNRHLNPSLVRSVVRGDHSSLFKPTLRPVSVLTLAVEGFSDQVDLVGPERMMPVIHQYFGIINDVVYEHEGLSVQVDLRGAVVVFGTPIPLDDTTAADLAASTGLQTLDQLKEMAEKWGVKGLPIHLSVCVGVASGPAVVGSFGPLERPIFSAIGPYMTLSRKLTTQGEEGELVVDSATRTALAERLSTRSIGAVEVRGLDYPIFAYAAQRSAR